MEYMTKIPEKELYQRWRIEQVYYFNINKDEHKKEIKTITTYLIPTIKLWRMANYVQIELLFIRRGIMILMHKPRMIKQHKFKALIRQLKFRRLIKKMKRMVKKKDEDIVMTSMIFGDKG